MGSLNAQTALNCRHRRATTTMDVLQTYREPTRDFAWNSDYDYSVYDAALPIYDDEQTASSELIDDSFTPTENDWSDRSSSEKSSPSLWHRSCVAQNNCAIEEPFLEYPSAFDYPYPYPDANRLFFPQIMHSAPVSLPPMRNEINRRRTLQPKPPADEYEFFGNVARVCNNCGSGNSPSWRRGAAGELLCNACGLYMKLHKVRRPRNFNANRLRRSRTRPTEVLRCKNCDTEDTPMWRRGDNRESLCNACGLYYRQHKVHRPLSIISKTPNSPKKSPGKEQDETCLSS